MTEGQRVVVGGQAPVRLWTPKLYELPPLAILSCALINHNREGLHQDSMGKMTGSFMFGPLLLSALSLGWF